MAVAISVVRRCFQDEISLLRRTLAEPLRCMNHFLSVMYKASRLLLLLLLPPRTYPAYLKILSLSRNRFEVDTGRRCKHHVRYFMPRNKQISGRFRKHHTDDSSSDTKVRVLLVANLSEWTTILRKHTPEERSQAEIRLTKKQHTRSLPFENGYHISSLSLFDLPYCCDCNGFPSCAKLDLPET